MALLKELGIMIKKTLNPRSDPDVPKATKAAIIKRKARKIRIITVLKLNLRLLYKGCSMLDFFLQMK